jgi:hypothetical protein
MPVNPAIFLVDRHYAFYFLSQLVYFRFTHLSFTEHFKREFLKRDPEAQNIVNTLDDRPDEFKTTPPMKETEVETVEKQEVGAEDTPFLRELSDDTDTPLDELEDGEFDELMTLIKGCRIRYIQVADLLLRFFQLAQTSYPVSSI